MMHYFIFNKIRLNYNECNISIIAQDHFLTYFGHKKESDKILLYTQTNSKNILISNNYGRSFSGKKI